MEDVMQQLVCLLLISAGVSGSHNYGSISISRDITPPAVSKGTDPWRPIRERSGVVHYVEPLGNIRYSVYEAPQEPAALRKHYSMDDDPSNKVEVFAPAPPSILGSFSAFGHATVNAREPATHIKMRKKQYEFQPAETRPAYSTLLRPPPLPPPLPHQQQAYFFEATLRPPKRDPSTHNALNIVPPPGSSPLSAAYYYDTSQHFKQQDDPETKFQSSGVNSPSRLQNNGYLGSDQTVYGIPKEGNRFKPSEQFDASNFNFYQPDHNNVVSSSYQSSIPGTTASFFSRNPFGDITLSTRRPDLSIKPVTEEKSPGKHVYEQLAHLARPFQTHLPHIQQPSSPRVPLYQTIVSSDEHRFSAEKQKIPNVGQPFQVPRYRNPLPSLQPALFSTQSAYLQELYPITVTTVDIPVTQPIQTVRPIQHNSKTREQEFGVSTSRPFVNPASLQPHNVDISAYHGREEEQTLPFLPTPATDAQPYLSQPSFGSHTAHPPAHVNEVQSTRKPSIQWDPPSETTVDVENEDQQRPRKKPPHHRRRRPTRPPLYVPTDWTENPSEEPTTTPIPLQYGMYRRRKKPNRNRTRGQSEYRRMTSTTAEPESVTMQELVTISEYVTHPVSVDSTYPTEQTYRTEETHPPTGEREHIIRDTQPPTQITEESQAPSAPDETTTSPSESITTSPAPITSPLSTTTFAVETSSASTRWPVRNKYPTRPRFSVKDYRERLKAATSTTTLSPSEEVNSEISKIRYPARHRVPTQYKREEEVSTESTRKYTYKSRLGPSRYKTSSTTRDPGHDTPTSTARINTFRPSGMSRYRPGTGKYYSRYRSSTVSPKDDLEQSSTTQRLPVRPKGVFSAKRRPYPLRTSLSQGDASFTERPKANSDHLTGELDLDLETVKSVDNEVVPATSITKKMDSDATPTTDTVSSIQSESVPSANAYLATSQRVADLTSSPSNSFESSSGVPRADYPNSRLSLRQITIATEDPILPIEAFFQSWVSNKDNQQK